MNKTYRIFLIGLCGIFTLTGCAKQPAWDHGAMDGESVERGFAYFEEQDYLSKATFAGGCFWCMEHPFEELSGVVEVISGFTGGSEVDPTYHQVASGQTEHTEAVQIYYRNGSISYEELLEVFWRQVDPTDSTGQFVDRGLQYRPGIFYRTERERDLAEQSKQVLTDAGVYAQPITLEISPFTHFYPAEDYHQNYYQKQETSYKRYRSGSGRDQFLDAVWRGRDIQIFPERVTAQLAKPSDEELRARLTELQYVVTQENATERPFHNEYWDHKEEGIYVDIVSGEALYSSTHKYDSQTGWPSFWETIAPENVTEDTDFDIGYPRTELRSVGADSHLGHLFNDGPAPTGLRHCINSAALRFVPKDQLEAQGYEDYRYLFGE